MSTKAQRWKQRKRCVIVKPQITSLRTLQASPSPGHMKCVFLPSMFETDRIDAQRHFSFFFRCSWSNHGDLNWTRPWYLHTKVGFYQCYLFRFSFCYFISYHEVWNIYERKSSRWLMSFSQLICITHRRKVSSVCTESIFQEHVNYVAIDGTMKTTCKATV